MIFDWFTLVFLLCPKNSSHCFPCTNPSITYIVISFVLQAQYHEFSPFNLLHQLLKWSFLLFSSLQAFPPSCYISVWGTSHLSLALYCHTSVWGINHLSLDLRLLLLAGPSSSRLTVFAVNSMLCLEE